MKRSSSTKAYNFASNTHEFKIGQSKIDSLPIRMASRRSSLRQLPNTEKLNQKSQIQLLREQNTALRLQNEKLKKKIQSLQKPPIVAPIKTEEKFREYRDILRAKFTTQTKTSRITTQCETGLFSSKQLSLDHSQLTISELYENYRLSSKLPALSDLREITEKFFGGYYENYTKIKALFQCLNINKKDSEYIKLSQLIELYKVPLLYQKSPQTLFRQLSKSKEISKSKNTKTSQDLCLQILSPQETIMRFEWYLQKLIKSSQIMKILKNNENVLKFISKIQSIKH